MNSSFRNISRDDILSSLGLQSRRSAADLVLPALGLFGVGLVVGAGLGLLFAPKSGAETREVIGGGISSVARKVTSRIRRTREEMTDGEDFEVAPRRDAAP